WPVCCLIMGCQVSPTTEPGPARALPMAEVFERSPLYYSVDQGQSWTPMGQGIPGEAQVSFLDTLEGEVVVATENMGLFLSDGHMTHWAPIGESLPGTKINALQVTQGELWVGIYQHGVFVSEDQGETWTDRTADLPDRRIQSFWKEGEWTLAGTDSGLFQYDTDEHSWVSLLPDRQIVSLFIQDGQWVAGTNRGTYLSADAGRTWALAHDSRAVHGTRRVDGNIAQCYINGDLYVSDDRGKSWREENYFPREGSYIYNIVSLGGQWLMSNNYGIHRSSDRGRSWQLIWPSEQMVFFEFLPLNGMVLCGTRDWNEYRGRTWGRQY
ncbi:MAG: hypothetical protein KDC54_08780, partial [Lewinella sp.]|nr:hypothetical protein [Lewinella sp.]